MTSENRNIGDFRAIVLNDNVNLILLRSENNSITVEAGTNLINNVQTEVDDYGVLVIKNNNNCNWIRNYDSPINVYLNYVDFDSIEYRSIGDITTPDTLVTDTLWLRVSEGAGKIDMKVNVKTLYCKLHYGTADIFFSGICGLSYVYSASFGFIDMVNLESNFMYVNNRSSNDIYVWPNTYLSAAIENIGNIYYKGAPSTIKLDRIGAGELIKIPD